MIASADLSAGYSSGDQKPKSDADFFRSLCASIQSKNTFCFDSGYAADAIVMSSGSFDPPMPQSPDKMASMEAHRQRVIGLAIIVLLILLFVAVRHLWGAA